MTPLYPRVPPVSDLKHKSLLANFHPHPGTVTVTVLDEVTNAGEFWCPNTAGLDPSYRQEWGPVGVG